MAPAYLAICAGCALLRRFADSLTQDDLPCGLTAAGSGGPMSGRHLRRASINRCYGSTLLDHIVGAGEQRLGTSRHAAETPYAARMAEAGVSSATDVGLFAARSLAVEREGRPLPGDTHLSFSLLASGGPDFTPVCARQLAVQSTSAARQSFGTAYGMSLISVACWRMLQSITA